MPVVNTKGAASSQGFGEFAKSGRATYIEDVFSTYLYTGTSTAGQSQTINNGIDLSTKGGLTIIKSRNQIKAMSWFDTTRGTSKYLWSNQTQQTNTFAGYGLTAFNNNGFTVTDQDSANDYLVNVSAQNYVSWTFRKQPKFFDVVTYTGTGGNRTVTHNLGSVPGCIIIKNASVPGNWQVYHNSLTSAAYGIQLNLTAAQASDATLWNNTAPTASVFSLGTSLDVNQNGATYVAYIFAHNAGGFGLTGTDNVISCGSYTGTGAAGNVVTLGYEPQWLLIKKSSALDDWMLFDTMRGLSVGVNDYALNVNGTTSEIGPNDKVDPTATGFVLTTPSGSVNTSGDTFIYIAIRRGPMKKPTTGTSVFTPSIRTGTGATGSSTALGAVTDLVFTKNRTSTAQTWTWTDRLRGATQELYSVNTSVETTKINDVTGFDINTGFNFGTGASGTINTSASTYIDYLFARAPSVFDIVCYTGTGAAATINHNLGVSPELVIIKSRSSGGTGAWNVYAAPLGFSSLQGLAFNDALPVGTYNPPVSAVSSTTFTNTSTSYVTGITYVAYLFASLTGVIKIGTYTGTGATQTINCGFTGGARFVMIKSVGSGNNGEWWALDTARGMVSGTDPRISTNNNTAENNTANWVLTTSVGFQVVTSDAEFNLSGNTYLYMAIA